MRELVRDFWADPAATDCSRVMRVPGFVNHKQRPGHLVRAEQLSTTLLAERPQHYSVEVWDLGRRAFHHARKVAASGAA